MPEIRLEVTYRRYKGQIGTTAVTDIPVFAVNPLIKIDVLVIQRRAF